MFVCLEAEITIIHWNWDVIVRYCLSLIKYLKESRKEGEKQVGHNINHQDLVFEKVL